jgi:hypothetical protein
VVAKTNRSANKGERPDMEEESRYEEERNSLCQTFELIAICWNIPCNIVRKAAVLKQVIILKVKYGDRRIGPHRN